MLTASMERIENRVHRLESSGSRGSSPVPKKRAERLAENTPQNWIDCDLCNRSSMEWSDNEDAEEKELPPPVSLSEDNRTLISSSFTSSAKLHMEKGQRHLPAPGSQRDLLSVIGSNFQIFVSGCRGQVSGCRTCPPTSFCAGPSRPLDTYPISNQGHR